VWTKGGIAISRRNLKKLDENLLKYDFVNRKFHTRSLGIETKDLG
jgi:hypothetical protein